MAHIQTTSSNPAALVDLIAQADQYFVAQRYVEALSCYEEAALQAPSDKNIQCNLATTLMQLGQLESAQANFEKALALDPQNPAALNNLATLLGRLGKKKRRYNGCWNLTSSRQMILMF